MFNKYEYNKQYNKLHKQEHSEYYKVYRKHHKVELNRIAKNFRERCKQRCFDELGSVCICCGESERKFLQIDHIRGGGRKDKKYCKTYSFRRIEIEGFPKDKYQILCSNCNWAKGLYGICPHQE